MFRFNNPDSLLVLLLVGAAYTMTRALEDGRLRWIVATGALVGFGFLAKEMQAFLVLPAFGLVYLLAGPPQLARRIGHVVLLGLVTLVAGGWWVAIVQLWPASSRPYIGGSQNNSFWNVLFGYNGFGRLTGNESGSVGGGGQGGTGNWGPTGLTRMFNSAFGGQISWLLPAALLLLVAGLAFTDHPRPYRSHTRRARAVGRLARGHRSRDLARSGDHPRVLLRGVGPRDRRRRRHRRHDVLGAPRQPVRADLPRVRHRGHRDLVVHRVAPDSDVVPDVAQCRARRRAGHRDGRRDRARPAGPDRGCARHCRGGRRSGRARGLHLDDGDASAHGLLPHRRSGRRGGRPGGFGGGGGGGANRAFAGGAAPGATTGGPPTGAFGNGGPFGTGNGRPPFGGAAGGNRGGIGGLLNGSTPSAAVTTLFEQSTGYRWTASAVGANNAAGYQLASGKAVMAIGGFNGTDPTPTLAQFEQYVKKGEIHYFITSGNGGGGPGGGTGGSSASTSSAITSWVESNFTAKTVGNTTIYDLSTGVAK